MKKMSRDVRYIGIIEAAFVPTKGAKPDDALSKTLPQVPFNANGFYAARDS
jgi:hypothetical protein